MILIVAHHFVVNSGLIGLIPEQKISSLSTYTMLLFGAWGKTGINCFVMISGYFMCTSRITLKKFVKLYTQIVFYSLVIGAIFFATSQIPLTKGAVVSYLLSFFPVHSVKDDFVGCFIVFWLCIPFLNILIRNMSRKQHLLITLLLVFFFSVMPSTYRFDVSFNYVEWFAILYLIASYIRLYPTTFNKISHKQWGMIAFFTVVIGAGTVIGTTYLWLRSPEMEFLPYFFISDSNKILSVLIGFTSFMYFKDLNIRYSKVINALGGATFGVLLIHSNSGTMRQWLWVDTVDVTGHYQALGPGMMLLYAVGVVLAIFLTCALIDIARSRYIEPWLNPKVERLMRTVWTATKTKLPLRRAVERDEA